MLSQTDLPLRFVDRGAFFDFLGPQDEPWLRVLLGEMARFEGRRRRDIAERLAEPLPCEAPLYKRRAATRVLLRLWHREQAAAVPPPRARALLFDAAASTDAPPDDTVAAVAARLNVDPATLTASLFADLPGERLLRAPTPVPDARDLMLRTNLAIAQTVLARASRLEIRVEGGVRPVVRLAKLRGLLCTVAGDTLEISGPFAVFRHTILYGRALAELLPHLVWCARFQLRAMCAIRDRLFEVSLDSGAPIFPAAAPAAFDSQVEERFARDFAVLAPDWDLMREPEPVPAGRTLIFPDFLVRHRIHTERRVLIEIAGFWTPDYLVTKLDRLRQARLDHFILCLNSDLACGDDKPPPGLTIVGFRRRVDAGAVLREVERLTGPEVAVSSGCPP